MIIKTIPSKILDKLCLNIELTDSIVQETPINVSDKVTGAVTGYNTIYTVPAGKYAILYIMNHVDIYDPASAFWNYARLRCYNSEGIKILEMDKDYALNTNFLSGTFYILKAGSYLKHEYSATNAACYNQVSIMGIEING